MRKCSADANMIVVGWILAVATDIWRTTTRTSGYARGKRCGYYGALTVFFGPHDEARGDRRLCL